MIIDCISDLHGHYPKLEGGDLLIIAGDLTACHTDKEFDGFINWLKKQPYAEKIFIAGNHDTMQKNPNPHGRLFGDGICYLQDWGTEFQGLKIWGSPWTSRFPGINPTCCAFTGKDDIEISDKFDLIPNNVDILITHTPPLGIKDFTKKKEYAGSYALFHRIFYDLSPILSVFGHIHESYGEIRNVEGSKTIFVNASYVNERYQPINPPIRIIL